jgi:hypothetical protein
MKKQFLFSGLLFACLLFTAIQSKGQYNYLWSGMMRSAFFTAEVITRSQETDANGNLYIGFRLDGTNDIDLTADSLMVEAIQDDNAIAKYSPEGNLLKYQIYGSGQNVLGNSIKYDQQGHIYVATVGSGILDFDPGPPVNPGLNVEYSIYLAKYDTSLNLIWAKVIIGDYLTTPGCSVKDIEISADGGIIITGVFIGSFDFDPSVDSANLTGDYWGDIYIAKYDTAGNYLWAKRTGSADQDVPIDLTSDANSNVYLTGNWQWAKIFFSKYSSAGDSLFNHVLDGIGYGKSIWIHSNNTFTVSGEFYNQVDFDPGTGVSYGTTPSSDYQYLFFAQYDLSGGFLSNRFITSSGQAFITSSRETPWGHLLLGGYFYGSLVTTPPFNAISLYATPPGLTPFYILELDESLQVVYANAIQTSHYCQDGFITNDYSGNVFVQIKTFDDLIDVDPGTGVVPMSNNGNAMVAVIKYQSDINGINHNDMTGTSPILVYPNPVGDLLQLNSDQTFTTLQISDLSGRILQTKHSASCIPVDVKELNAGMYFLTLYTYSGEKYYCKFLKQ